MKVVLPKINRIFLTSVTVIQCFFAAILIAGCVKAGKFSILSLIVFAAFVCFTAFLTMKKKLWLPVAIYILTMPVILDTVVSGEHFAGLPEKPKGSFQELKVQRLVWPYISEMGYSYGLDVMDDLAYVKLSVSSKSLWEDFFPAVEAKYGDYAGEIYNRYTELSMESQKRKVIPEIGSDFCDYVFAPVTTELNFFGHTGSFNGENYNDLKHRMGEFGRVYYHFGFAAFAIIVALGLLSMFVNKSFPGVKISIVAFLLVAIISLYDIFFVLRGFDYKNAAPITLIWALYWCGALRGKNADC